MAFGENLRKGRLGMGWTQQQLADRMGKTKNNISQYELGKRDPNCEQLLSFARLLGVSTDQLLGRDAPAVLHEDTKAHYANAPVLAPIYESYPFTEPADFRFAPHDLPNAQTLFFFRAPDDSMTDYRIEQGDLLLLRDDDAPFCSALHLLHMPDGRAALRMVRADPDGRYLLQASARYAPEWLAPDALCLLGRLLRVEFAL